MAQLYLATCSFPEMRPEFGVGVRISRGFPRYKLKYELEHVCRTLMPALSYLNVADEKVFITRFEAQLEEAGAKAIGAELKAIAAHTGAGQKKNPIVLLCFEQLHRGVPCHRRYFADWWERQTGRAVPELGAM